MLTHLNQLFKLKKTFGSEIYHGLLDLLSYADIFLPFETDKGGLSVSR